MFKRIKWGAYAPLEFSPVGDLEVLQKLITVCFPTAHIDRTSRKAKELLDYGVITLTDGQDVEHHSYADLIYHKLPYVLFSNNLWYVKGYRSQMLQMGNPIQHLARMVEQYHQRFKHDRNFHL